MALLFNYDCDGGTPEVGTKISETTTTETFNGRVCQKSDANNEIIQVPKDYFKVDGTPITFWINIDHAFNGGFKYWFLCGRFTYPNGDAGDIYLSHFNTSFILRIYSDVGVYRTVIFDSTTFESICEDGDWHKVTMAINNVDPVEGSSHAVVWLDDVLQPITLGDITSAFTHPTPVDGNFGFAGNGVGVDASTFFVGGRIDEISVGIAPPSFGISDWTDGLGVAATRHIEQRNNSGQGSITFPVGYPEGTSAVSVRIMQGTTVVKDWATALTSPSGTSDDITVTGVAQGPVNGSTDFYTVEIRNEDDSEIAISEWDFGVGDLYGLMGQSNTKEWTNDDPTEHNGVVDPYNLVTDNPLAMLFRRVDDAKNYGANHDPAGSYGCSQIQGWNQLVRGNGGQAFCNAIIESENIPVALVDGAVNGVPVTYYNTLTSTAGLQFYPSVDEVGGRLAGMIILNGEDEAIEDETGQYTSRMNTLLATIRANISYKEGSSEDLPVFLGIMGRTVGVLYSDVRWQEIRDYQNTFIEANTSVYFGCSNIDLGLQALIHTAFTDQIKVGQRMAQSVLDFLGSATYSEGPDVYSWESVSATQTTIWIKHNGGSDFTPITGIEGFRAFDDAVEISISSAARSAYNAILLTHDAVTGVRSFDYMYGKDETASGIAEVTNAVRDDTGLLLPLKSVSSVVEGEAPPATPVTTITSPTSAPTYATTSNIITISGSATIESGSVASVGWSNSRGGSGACEGTSSWTKAGIVLLEGVNILTVTATSVLGETSAANLTVTYTPSVSGADVDAIIGDIVI